MPVYSIQLGSSRHPRALRVRSTIQLTSIVTKGMTKSSEIDVVINNGDDDDDDVEHYFTNLSAPPSEQFSGLPGVVNYS